MYAVASTVPHNKHLALRHRINCDCVLTSNSTLWQRCLPLDGLMTPMLATILAHWEPAGRIIARHALTLLIQLIVLLNIRRISQLNIMRAEGNNWDVLARSSCQWCTCAVREGPAGAWGMFCAAIGRRTYRCTSCLYTYVYLVEDLCRQGRGRHVPSHPSFLCTFRIKCT